METIYIVLAGVYVIVWFLFFTGLYGENIKREGRSTVAGFLVTLVASFFWWLWAGLYGIDRAKAWLNK